MRILPPLAAVVLVFSGTPGLPAQEAPTPAAASYEAGLQALGDNLPELAIPRFRDALAQISPEDPLQADLNRRLGEALVRAGNPAEALTVLATLPDDPVAQTWSGYAQVLSGQLAEAEETFAGVAAGGDDELAEAVLLARARLLAALGRDKALIEVLDQLAESEKPAIIAESGLIRVANHLSRQRFEEAASALPEIKPTTPAQEGLLQFLSGLTSLKQDDAATAVSAFEALLEESVARALPLREAVTLAYADALHASGNASKAVDFLIEHLTTNPEASDAAASFERLTEWSRDTDALRELVNNRLMEWAKPPAYGFLHRQDDPIATSVAAQSAQVSSPLAPLALLHRAQHLAERNDEASVTEAKRLLARLRMETDDPALVTRSLLETSRLHLATGDREAALSALRALELFADSPGMRTRAAELAGVIRHGSGEFAEAAAAFTRVNEYLGPAAGDSDILNLGLSLLLSNSSDQFGSLLASLDPGELKRSLELERLLLSASRLDPEAREGLDLFLRENPRHPRSAEVRLALAELSIEFEPRDLTMAEAQLSSIDPAILSRPLALRHLLCSLRLSELTGEWADAIASGNSYLTTFPDSPLDAVIRLKIGEACFLNGDYNRAQRIFQQLAADEAAAAYREASLFFAARSALKVLTPEARDEAVALLEEVVTINGPLSGDARLQLARAHLDGGNTGEALDILEPLLDPEKPMAERLDPLVLQAEAFRTLGTSEGDEKAVALLEQCLAWEDLSYPESNRLHYVMALTLEQLGRKVEALDVLYRVVNRENLPEEGAAVEWTHFYNCGFKAIRLLGEQGNWKGAYGIARRLAESKGPRREEAEKRARAIQLEHMIWDPKAPTEEPATETPPTADQDN